MRRIRLYAKNDALIHSCYPIANLTGCLGIPEGIEPIDEFELNRYLGKWYEIDKFIPPPAPLTFADFKISPDGLTGTGQGRREWPVGLIVWALGHV